MPECKGLDLNTGRTLPTVNIFPQQRAMIRIAFLTRVTLIPGMHPPHLEAYQVLYRIVLRMTRGFNQPVLLRIGRMLISWTPRRLPGAGVFRNVLAVRETNR